MIGIAFFRMQRSRRLDAASGVSPQEIAEGARSEVCFGQRVRVSELPADWETRASNKFLSCAHGRAQAVHGLVGALVVAAPIASALTNAITRGSRCCDEAEG